MRRALAIAVIVSALAACDNDKPTTISEVRPAPAQPPPPAPTAVPAPPPAPAQPSTNRPPTLVVKIRPDPASGPAPHDVNVNMCQSSDPDGDRLIFEFKWGGTGRAHFSFNCRDDHTYTVRGTYRSFFCVNDNNDHRVCQNELITIF